MNILPNELVFNILSFECAYSFSLLSKECRKLVKDNFSSPVVNRSDDTNIYDLDENVPYIDIASVYTCEKLEHASNLVRIHIDEHMMDELTETAIDNGISRMWDYANIDSTVPTLVKDALEKIEAALAICLFCDGRPRTYAAMYPPEIFPATHFWYDPGRALSE